MGKLSGQGGEHAIGNTAHDEAAGENTCRDAEEGRDEAHPQKGGDERTGPGAGTGQRDGDKEEEPPFFVGGDLGGFLIGAADEILEKRADFGEGGELLHYCFGKQHQKGDGQQVAQHTNGEHLPEGETHGGPHRDAAAQFHDG